LSYYDREYRTVSRQRKKGFHMNKRKPQQRKNRAYIKVGIAGLVAVVLVNPYE
jgi:hypothetical protein